MSIVYLALGTNLGDRLSNLRAAIDALPPSVTVLDESHVYETEPWGYADQPAFLNMVIKARTELAPQELLAHLKSLETSLGRVASFRNGPRQIDIDILFYDMMVLDTPPLVIPHPRLHERVFVLIPLADVAAEFVHPVLGEFIWQLMGRVELAGIRHYEEK